MLQNINCNNCTIALHQKYCSDVRENAIRKFINFSFWEFEFSIDSNKFESFIVVHSLIESSNDFSIEFSIKTDVLLKKLILRHCRHDNKISSRFRRRDNSNNIRESKQQQQQSRHRFSKRKRHWKINEILNLKYFFEKKKVFACLYFWNAFITFDDDAFTQKKNFVFFTKFRKDF